MNKPCISLVVVLSLLVVSISWAQQGSGFKFLEVKIVDPEGKPVADATVDVTIDAVSFPMPTDEGGMISLNVPAGPNSSLQLKVQKDGFAAVSGTWGAGDEIPTEIEIALKPGAEIGGIVHDEHGDPVEGVTVEVVGAINQPLAGRLQATLGGQIGTTDGEGRWRYTGAPDQKVNAYLHLSHPNYANDNNRHAVTYEQLRAMDHILVLKKGIELRGTVTDPQGDPVQGAKISLGSDLGQRDQFQITDDQGKYLFGNLPAGQTVMTVYSPDFAPDLKVVMAKKSMEPVDFQLRKGKPMRIRVTDPDGKPISNVGVVPDTWRGHRTLYQLGMPERTDENGLCVWENAPEDEMIYDFWHDRHMSLRNQPLTAGGEQHEIELGWPLVVKGTVADAATGKPIDLFNAIEGIRWDTQRDEVYWERYNMEAGRDGQFELRFTEPREAHLVRIEAHGYRPAISREIHDDEGEVTLEFKLEPGTGPSGVVKLPDGSPAADAKVVMASVGGQIYINNGESQDQNQSVHVVADEQGRYKLPFPDSDYVVVFLHNGGWAQFVGTDLETSPNVTLNKWARLEGVVRVADKPAAGEQVNVNFNDNTHYDAGRPRIYWSNNSQTDDEGKFVFERLKAGEANVGRMISYGKEQMRMSTYSHSVPVQLKAGETTEVQIGGSGRQVKGKIVLPDDYEGPNPWSMGHVQIHQQQSRDSGVGQLFFQLGRALAQNNAWNPAFVAQASPPAPRRSYSAAIDEEGSFQIDDVLPGSYGMHVMVYEPPVSENYSWNILGTANGQVAVGEEGDGPVEAGEFELQLQQRPDGQWTTGTLQVAPVEEVEPAE